VRRGLEPITVSREDELREAGLATLARLSDRSARKKLLGPYDDDVKDNPQWAKARARRAAVYFRIGDYDDAIEDYEEAIDLTRLDGRSEPSYYAELARCQVREGKLKDARDTLRRSPLSLAKLHELAEDPDFRELRDSKYGDEAFGLDSR
jgi:tetratricopeptide (TPR) repeat protein